jgi:hypothetical protein
MPRFYFDVDTGSNLSPDRRGIELPDPEMALLWAQHSVETLKRVGRPDDGSWARWRLIIRSDAGVLHEVEFEIGEPALPG